MACRSPRRHGPAPHSFLHQLCFWPKHHDNISPVHRAIPKPRMHLCLQLLLPALLLFAVRCCYGRKMQFLDARSPATCEGEGEGDAEDEALGHEDEKARIHSRIRRRRRAPASWKPYTFSHVTVPSLQDAFHCYTLFISASLDRWSTRSSLGWCQAYEVRRLLCAQS